MRDTLKIECLLEAMDSYASASTEERTAREAYDGYSWGYYGYRYIEAKERAAEEVQKHLRAFIAEEIAAAMGGKDDRS